MFLVLNLCYQKDSLQWVSKGTKSWVCPKEPKPVITSCQRLILHSLSTISVSDLTERDLPSHELQSELGTTRLEEYYPPPFKKLLIMPVPHHFATWDEVRSTPSSTSQDTQALRAGREVYFSIGQCPSLHLAGSGTVLFSNMLPILIHCSLKQLLQ